MFRPLTGALPAGSRQLGPQIPIGSPPSCARRQGTVADWKGSSGAPTSPAQTYPLQILTENRIPSGEPCSSQAFRGVGSKRTGHSGRAALLHVRTVFPGFLQEGPGASPPCPLLLLLLGMDAPSGRSYTNAQGRSGQNKLGAPPPGSLHPSPGVSADWSPAKPTQGRSRRVGGAGSKGIHADTHSWSS